MEKTKRKGHFLAKLAGAQTSAEVKGWDQLEDFILKNDPWPEDKDFEEGLQGHSPTSKIKRGVRDVSLTIAELREEVRRRRHQVSATWNVMQYVEKRHEKYCEGCGKKLHPSQWVHRIADLGFRCFDCFSYAAHGMEYFRSSPLFDPKLADLEARDPLAAQLEFERKRRLELRTDAAQAEK